MRSQSNDFCKISNAVSVLQKSVFITPQDFWSPTTQIICYVKCRNPISIMIFITANIILLSVKNDLFRNPQSDVDGFSLQTRKLRQLQKLKNNNNRQNLNKMLRSTNFSKKENTQFQISHKIFINLHIYSLYNTSYINLFILLYTYISF